MSFTVPRVTLNADFENNNSFGELSLISVGYGLHQAWVFSSMFSTQNMFGVNSLFTGIYGSSVTLTFLISIIAYAFVLITSALLSKRVLNVFISRKTLVAAGVLMCLGTGIILIPAHSVLPIFEILGGIITGLGSAVLILYWTTAFARCEGASIVLNTAVGTFISIAVFSLILCFSPYPVGAILTALIPLVEVAILWNKTPIPYSKRSGVPIFKPLPINQGKFFIRFGVPVLIMGVALGVLRTTSLTGLLKLDYSSAQVYLLIAAGIAMVLILITIMAITNSTKWTLFFRALIPFIAVTIFFIPFAGLHSSVEANVIILVGFLCFEALTWVFFCELSQRFRLSPVFVGGTGRGMLAIGILISSILPALFQGSMDEFSFSEQTIVVVLLMVIVISYALLPSEREIQAIVVPCPLVKAVDATLDANIAAPSNASANQVQQNTTQQKETPTESTSNNVMQNNYAQSAAKTPSAARLAMEGKTTTTQSENVKRGGGRFRAKCETVANTYLLSRREAEILFLLAKGNKSAYIQEKLYISEGTAKTHIRHIYRKLDVHSQQELMRTVEDTKID